MLLQLHKPTPTESVRLIYKLKYIPKKEINLLNPDLNPAQKTSSECPSRLGQVQAQKHEHGLGTLPKDLGSF